MRTCPKCKQAKDLCNFNYKSVKGKRYPGYCQDCVSQVLRDHRAKTLQAMGGRCEKCGFDDARALQIDHVNGGGIRERKKFGRYKIENHILSYLPNKCPSYQLLCANCNWIKRAVLNEAKGRPKSTNTSCVVTN